MSRPYGRVLGSLLAVALAVTASLSADEGNPTTGSAESGGDLIGPQIILKSQQPPVFPPAAKAGRFSGSVMVEATILEDGKVGEVKVLECSRPKVGFEQASIDAVKNWVFEPGTRAGEPVEFTLKFRLNFSGGGDKPRVSAGAFTSSSRDGAMASRDAGTAARTGR